jgi:thioredoxin 1
MATPEYSVACLCAEWCGVCRDYRAGFLALAQRFPQAHFAWLDMEDDAAELDEAEVENFPTITVKRGAEVLFHGVMPPQHAHLARLLEELFASR